jgi:hypothetical protein
MEKTRRNRIILCIGVVTAIAIIAVGYLPKANSFSGFQGKTLWDWLSLLVVPASLAGLGALLQLKDQDRAKKQADLEREIADKNRQQDLEIAQGTREEEALQHYLDRVSNLVIEKNLLEIAAKDAPTTEEKELLDVSVDIIRALTLSTLRRLSDGIRKGSVVRLLAEADIIQRLGVSLDGADLQTAFLNFAVLYRADLSGADLACASLIDTELNEVRLSGAFLNFANLSGADLTGADLSDAYLSGAIGVTKEQLEKAYLCGTELPKGIDIDPNRDCDKFYGEWLSEHGYI